ncbi:hypothetical protein INT43_008735 [Umbelopsis isabellina]|uniref:Mei2-like C-terminal RNA recognition motif domain-containing protein n=1 Tax=Mortierella isabellina TaxID=91625 RepID=A0A8H7PWJ9_MORIS|nr:hypothetical protein INT43_008735 [Umbelopsis isabellina]
MSQEPSAKTAAMMMQDLDDRYYHQLRLDDFPPISTIRTTVFQPTPQHSFLEPLPYTKSNFQPWKETKCTVSPTTTMSPWAEALYQADSMGMNASDSSGTSSDSSLSLHSEGIFRQNELLHYLRTWSNLDAPSNCNLKASRCVLIQNIGSHVNVQDIVDTIRSLGDVKLMITERMHAFHELVVVFHDIRHAQILVVRVSLASQMTDPLYGTWATYCVNEDIAKRFAITLPYDSEFTVKVDGSNATTVSSILSSYGNLQSLRQYEITQSQSVFVGEYFDDRSMLKAVKELQDHNVQHVHFDFRDSPALTPISAVVQQTLCEEPNSFPKLEYVPSEVSQPFIVEYGSSEQQSIDNFLQMLNNFKSSSTDVSLEELEPIANDTQHETFRKQVSYSSSNEIDIDRILMGQEKRTTCMIRNIPNKIIGNVRTTKGRQKMASIFSKCVAGLFQFVIDLASRSRFNSEKRCTLSYANIQGKKALIDKFRNSSVMDEEISYQPKIFFTSGQHRGEEESFPPPTVSSDIRKRKQRQTLTVKSQRSSSFLDYYHHVNGTQHGDV